MKAISEANAMHSLRILGQRFRYSAYDVKEKIGNFIYERGFRRLPSCNRHASTVRACLREVRPRPCRISSRSELFDIAIRLLSCFSRQLETFSEHVIGKIRSGLLAEICSRKVSHVAPMAKKWHEDERCCG